VQDTGRKHGEMSGQVRVFGMQLAAEVFDEFPDRISQVSHQGITRCQHDPEINYTPWPLTVVGLCVRLAGKRRI